jgi:hypothetical protein
MIRLYWFYFAPSAGFKIAAGYRLSPAVLGPCRRFLISEHRDRQPHTITKLLSGDSMDLWPMLWKISWGKHRNCGHWSSCVSAARTAMHAVRESFISYLRVVKSGWRNRLKERNLTDLMRNKVTGPTLHVFHERFRELAVDLWNSDKLRRKTQGNQKQYAARGNA